MIKFDQISIVYIIFICFLSDAYSKYDMFVVCLINNITFLGRCFFFRNPRGDRPAARPRGGSGGAVAPPERSALRLLFFR